MGGVVGEGGVTIRGVMERGGVWGQRWGRGERGGVEDGGCSADVTDRVVVRHETLLDRAKSRGDPVPRT